MRKKFLAVALILALAAAFCPKITPTALAAETPTRVITSGIRRWYELTDRNTDKFVAVNFAEDCAYYLNGSNRPRHSSTWRTIKEEVQAAAAQRGTVVEFYTNTDGNINVVKAYEYTVDQVEGGEVSTKALADGTLQIRVPGVIEDYTDADKVTGWQGLTEGDVVLYYKTEQDDGTCTYTIEKAEKVTGNVSSFSTDGKLTVNNKDYRASEQVDTGTIGDVRFSAFASQSPLYGDYVFAQWIQTGQNMVDDYAFYLDKGGYIVACSRLTQKVFCQGFLGDNSELLFTCAKNGAVTFSGDIPQSETVFVACYDDAGRFTGVKCVDRQTLETQVGTGLAKMKLFWLGGNQAPRCNAGEITLTP